MQSERRAFGTGRNIRPKMKSIFHTKCRCLTAFVLLQLLNVLTARSQTSVIFPITQAWKYNQTQNLDATNWTSVGFDDSSWPSGVALLYSETNAAVFPRNTALNLGRTTYYFRTHFNFSGNPANTVLTFSNKIDDGAVFHLNGSEVQRVRMTAAPAAISYATFATGTPTGGDATNYDVFSIPGTNLVSGDNVLAVEAHQSSSTSSDIVFGSGLSTGLGISRGPYLQSGSSSNVIVRWRSVFATDCRVRFGTNVGNLDLVAQNLAVTNEHQILLNGLSANAKYFYAVGSTSDNLSGDTNYFFTTAPEPGTAKPTRIWVIGDAGRKDSNQQAVRDAYYAFTGSRETDLWLMLGDNAYDNGTDAEYQAAVFDMYSVLLRKSVLWSALGNHETAQSTAFNDSYPYFSLFTFPTNSVAGGMASGTEHYYSFDYGNIHFICLDSMTASRATNGAMATWLRADLNSTTNRWIIAFWHHPPYTKGSHNSDTETPLIEMRQNFLPILEEGGVDLVLTGHSHSYERSFLLDGHYSFSTNLVSSMKLNPNGGRENQTGAYIKTPNLISHQGAVYAVVGSSGQISGGNLNHPAMFVSLNLLGSMVLDIDGDRLDAKFLRETGAVNDYFTILKREIGFEAATILANGAMQLTLTNVAAGKTNILQASTNLADWVSVSTNNISSNWLNYVDADATNYATRIYRMMRLP
jgi:hypothetical protein